MFEIGRLWRDRQQEGVKSRRASTSGKKGSVSARRESRAFSEAASTHFADALAEADLRLLDESIELFMGEVMKQGERLKHAPNKREFFRYKSMISRFLKEVVDRSLKTVQTQRRGREYVFADIIDEKLLKLGHYLLLEEADTIEIAATIDEIKGLLYDSFKASKGEQ